MTDRFLEVFAWEDGAVARRIEVTGKSEAGIERVMSGLLMQMDTDKYGVRDTADSEEQP